jgi:hypothetical protein
MLWFPQDDLCGPGRVVGGGSADGGPIWAMPRDALNRNPQYRTDLYPHCFPLTNAHKYSNITVKYGEVCVPETTIHFYREDDGTVAFKVWLNKYKQNPKKHAYPEDVIDG